MKETRFCTECGSAVQDGETYCTGCGVAIADQQRRGSSQPLANGSVQPIPPSGSAGEDRKIRRSSIVAISTGVVTVGAVGVLLLASGGSSDPQPSAAPTTGVSSTIPAPPTPAPPTPDPPTIPASPVPPPGYKKVYEGVYRDSAHTSEGFAERVFDAWRVEGNGTLSSVKSPVSGGGTGDYYYVTCKGTEVVICTGGDPRYPAHVWIDTDAYTAWVYNR